LFILDDPIFNGLAVSLIFGILVSTMLTLVVIPVVLYAYSYKRETRGTTDEHGADAAAAA
jgi:Cu/Ag efflux pump CusA